MTENKSIIDLARAAEARPLNTEQPSTPPPTGEQPPKPSKTGEPEEGSAPKEILAELLKNVQSKIGWSQLRLPSAGFNPSKIDTIEIRPFTFEDEKLLRTTKTLSQGELIVEQLITRCIRGIEYKDLLLTDKNYILFKLREISYGDEYDIKAVCNTCEAENELKVELSKLPVIYAESAEDLEYKATLPDSGVEVTVKALRLEDEAILANPVTLIDNMWRLVESIGGHTERTVKQGFITGTTVKDISVIRNAIFGGGVGMQTKVNYVCNSCDTGDVLELPINEGFFDAN
tara:strand:+ start:180 stop:1043 length:864 start_codon:yes stop_codon:yes gene_type:complete